MPVLAELDVHHSRPIAPTRRVALGDRRLPVDPPPGFGGILLGGVVAAHARLLDPDIVPDLLRLTAELEAGRTIAQPRLRYRLQVDRVGLLRSRFRLVGSGEALRFDFDVRCAPAQAVLGAVYAAGEAPRAVRGPLLATVRRATRWRGDLGPDLVRELTVGGHRPDLAAAAGEDPRAWALSVLGLVAAGAASAEVQRRFRALLRQAHPDHGGAGEAAARRIAELTEARRILLGR